MGRYSRFGYLLHSSFGAFKDGLRGALLPFGWWLDVEKGRDDFRDSTARVLFYWGTWGR